MTSQRDAERFWRKVDKSGPNGCWLWTSVRTRGGYGQFDIRHPVHGWRPMNAHRFAYELLVGPIPAGLQLDHLCRNRSCVNPAHLEPVTQRENILRGISPAAINARKTHCIRGHEFTPENTTVSTLGARNCRACMAAHQPWVYSKISGRPPGAFTDGRTRILLAVVREYAAEGRCTVLAVARRAGVSISTAHHHLVALRDAELVTWEPQQRGTLRPVVAEQRLEDAS